MVVFLPAPITVNIIVEDSNGGIVTKTMNITVNNLEGQKLGIVAKIENHGASDLIFIDNNLINQNGTLSHFGNDFTLIYRIYGPNLNYYENPISIPVASIINEGCK